MKRPLGKASGESAMMKSRFNALLFPVSSEEEVDQVLAQLKKDYPKADHYPYAYRLQARGKSSDDGEPGGSAGRPLLTLLESGGIDGAFLGVARYFGGTKLGVGNLRRCFVEAGAQALEAAELGEEVTEYVYEISVSYSAYQTLEKLSRRLGFRLEESVFAELVSTKMVSDGKLDNAWESMGFRQDELPQPQERIVLRRITK